MLFCDKKISKENILIREKGKIRWEKSLKQKIFRIVGKNLHSKSKLKSLGKIFKKIFWIEEKGKKWWEKVWNKKIW